MVMNNSGGGNSSFNAKFSTALGVSLALPLVALIAAAAAVWYLKGFNSLNGLDTRWEIFFLSVLGGAIVVSLIIVSMFSRLRTQIRQQVNQLTDTCRAVAEGAGQARAPVTGTDEFATLATQMNVVLAGRESGGGIAANDITNLQSQIEKLLQEVSAVGEGDLTIQAEVTPDTLGVLADSFNYMIEELAKVVGRVQSTTQQVIHATRRIIDRSGDLARIAEAQTAQISQTSEQVEEVAAFILSTARNATLSADAAQEALRRAGEGKEAVIQTIGGMNHIRANVQDTANKIKRLGERTQEISDIVRIIEDLSEQTNLLALNAAIQSAMAGENGRGFAVVADEIRLLAEKSSEAAKRIVGLVKNIQSETQEAVVAMEESTTEVVSGSAMADNAGSALEDILFAVEHQARMVEEIARTANERTQTSEAVAMAMNRISDITRQTNATMHDTAASVSYLAEIADQLRLSVSAFRLPSHVMQPPTPGLAPPARADGYIPPYTTSGMPALPPGQGSGYMGGQMPPFDVPGQNTAQRARPPASSPFPDFGAAPNGPALPFPGFGQPQTGPAGPLPPGFGQQAQTGQFAQRPYGQPTPDQRPRLPDRQNTGFDPWEDEQQSADGRGTWDGHSPGTGNSPYQDR